MAKQKVKYSDGQQSLFDDFVKPSVISQADRPRAKDMSKHKPGTATKTLKTVRYTATEMLTKGRKPVFIVDETIRQKYPFIRHQPAVLMDYRNIVDVVIRENDKEYWIGIDRHKNEVLPGSFKKKIPEHLKDSVMEYIENLRIS